ncbi:lytic transglycosylase domain-containing protein [Neoactinobaculum massilliense]|uniref:lytic transglycosylase domain-containing protein n=1 Tax=Neoactinobaculum massilliense TaxID=2364794 RepID=UPI001F15707B|nr:lytic transglycosylase domain-containing protein [Neoactinobaculum massilliense]
MASSTADRLHGLHLTPHLTPTQLREYLREMTVPSRVDMQDAVSHTATIMGVNPHLAMGVAYIESGFEAAKVSDSGAIGVMQLGPEAAEWAGLLVGRELNPLNPADNITAGIAILRYLLRHTSSVHEAVGAYYQGLASIRSTGPLPATQNYVTRVVRAARLL